MRLHLLKAPQVVGLASSAHLVSCLPLRAHKQASRVRSRWIGQHHRQAAEALVQRKVNSTETDHFLRRRSSCRVSAEAGQKMDGQQLQTSKEPAGMEKIAAQLEQFLQIPTASKVWFQGGAAQTVTVRLKLATLMLSFLRMNCMLQSAAVEKQGSHGCWPCLKLHPSN